MEIKIQNAYENNLKNIDISIPKNKLIAFTGVSGSGKSTLALDTLQRECQRLYMESLGMTLNMGDKAKVGSIEGLSPAISITQHQSNNNPRSTVGTITELTSYLRVLFSKIGKSDSKKKNTFLENITANHFSYNKPEGACPNCSGIGTINSPDIYALINMEKSILDFAIYGWDQVYIDRYGTSLIEAARHYGFTIDIAAPIKEYNAIQIDLLLYGVLSEQIMTRFPNVTPPKTVPLGRFEGVVTNILRRYLQPNISPLQKKKMEKFFHQQTCPVCEGKKWNKEVLNIYIKKDNIQTVLQKSIFEMQEWIADLRQLLSSQELIIVDTLLTSISEKVNRLIDVGIGYLSLDQTAGTLSSGEWQRIKLTSVISSGLTGVLYILDEPSAGLHPRDLYKIIYMLKKLRDLGNTVLVIEHNLEIIKAVDYIIDFGPGAGQNGGTIVATGTPDDIMKESNSLTGYYLSNLKDNMVDKLIKNSTRHIKIENACLHNLKNVTVEIPLDSFVAVTGVSGSGKTNLIFGVLADYAEHFYKEKRKTSRKDVSGLEQIDNIITINDSSVGRSSRSNVATYTELFTDIRNLFAKQSKQKNFKFSSKDFSTNTVGGRCEECQGNGMLAVPMHFLPDVLIVCPKCQGKRFTKEILEVTYRGYHISDILYMDIDRAIQVFSNNPIILFKLNVLQEVGLGYLLIGQATSTLSGGEAQRLKLAKELMKQGKSNKLYLFDEPTTGLHPHDILKVIKIFERLVEQGNSVIVIEHNLNVISRADYIIQMGPEGGKAGGYIIAKGTPLSICNKQ